MPPFAGIAVGVTATSRPWRRLYAVAELAAPTIS
jgi:hypothetical protein